MLKVIKLTGLCWAVALVSMTSSATLVFQSGSTSSQKQPVDATADVSISGTTVTVTLTDNLADPVSVGSVLNGIQLDISGAKGASNLSADNAKTVTIDKNKVATTGTANGQTIASNYGLSGYSAITLSALSTGPNYLIIGPGPYSNSKGSIAGNGPHNPFINGSETFSFSLAGASSFSESDVTGVTFLFGTSCWQTSPGVTTYAAVPEPSTVIAAMLLLLPLGLGSAHILRKHKVC